MQEKILVKMVLVDDVLSERTFSIADLFQGRALVWSNEELSRLNLTPHECCLIDIRFSLTN
jgi:hypothetical protein